MEAIAEGVVKKQFVFHRKQQALPIGNAKLRDAGKGPLEGMESQFVILKNPHAKVGDHVGIAIWPLDERVAALEVFAFVADLVGRILALYIRDDGPLFEKPVVAPNVFRKIDVLKIIGRLQILDPTDGVSVVATNVGSQVNDPQLATGIHVESDHLGRQPGGNGVFLKAIAVKTAQAPFRRDPDKALLILDKVVDKRAG